MRSEPTSYPKQPVAATSNTTAAFVKEQPFAKARQVEGTSARILPSTNWQAQCTEKPNTYYKILQRSCWDKLDHPSTYETSQRLLLFCTAKRTPFLVADGLPCCTTLTCKVPAESPPNPTATHLPSSLQTGTQGGMIQLADTSQQWLPGSLSGA